MPESFNSTRDRPLPLDCLSSVLVFLSSGDWSRSCCVSHDWNRSGRSIKQVCAYLKCRPITLMGLMDGSCSSLNLVLGGVQPKASTAHRPPIQIQQALKELSLVEIPNSQSNSVPWGEILLNRFPSLTQLNLSGIYSQRILEIVACLLGVCRHSTTCLTSIASESVRPNISNIDTIHSLILPFDTLISPSGHESQLNLQTRTPIDLEADHARLVLSDLTGVNLNLLELDARPKEHFSSATVSSSNFTCCTSRLLDLRVLRFCWFSLSESWSVPVRHYGPRHFDFKSISQRLWWLPYLTTLRHIRFELEKDSPHVMLNNPRMSPQWPADGVQLYALYHQFLRSILNIPLISLHMPLFPLYSITSTSIQHLSKCPLRLHSLGYLKLKHRQPENELDHSVCTEPTCCFKVQINLSSSALVSLLHLQLSGVSLNLELSRGPKSLIHLITIKLIVPGATVTWVEECDYPLIDDAITQPDLYHSTTENERWESLEKGLKVCPVDRHVQVGLHTNTPTLAETI